MFRFRVIVGIVTLLMCGPAWSTECKNSDLSPRIRYYLDVIAQEAKQKPTWFNHKLSEYPTFIIDTKANNQCAVLYRPAQDLHPFKLGQMYKEDSDHGYFPIFDPAFSNLQYGNDGNEPSRKQMQQMLVSLGVKKAFVWVWGSYEPDLSDPQAREYSEKGTPSLARGMSLAIHEAFHYMLQHQFATERDKVWTEFGNTRLSDEDLFRCYLGTSEVKEIHRKEMEAILAAFTTNKRSTKIGKIKEFIQLRRQRNSMLPSVQYTDWNNQVHTASCAENEARQELGEGVPQFVGNALILDLKLSSRKQIAYEIEAITNYYMNTKNQGKERPIQSYYHTGALSLLLIRDLYRGNFLKLTEEVSQPGAKYVLTDLLETIVGY